MDWEAEGLLEGLSGAERAGRVALLDELEAQGVSPQEIRRSCEQGELLFTLAGAAIGVLPQYTWDELLERSGASEPFALAMLRLNGFARPAAGERWFSDHDVDALRRTREFVDAGVPVDDALLLARILGRAFAQSAEVMRSMVLRMVHEPGLGERELALRYARLAGEMTPAMEPLLADLLRQHLRQVSYAETVHAAKGSTPGSLPVAVGFADLVGFTRLGEQMPPDELSAVAGRLEDLLLGLVEPPVRFVKSIGDAVMVVSPEPEPLVDTTLALLEAADSESDDFPQLRAGLAAGEALSRGGDWYGRPVNLASRVTAIARPGSVLATAELHEAAPGEFRWSKAGIRPLKGIDEPVALWRVRRAEG